MVCSLASWEGCLGWCDIAHLQLHPASSGGCPPPLPRHCCIATRCVHSALHRAGESTSAHARFPHLAFAARTASAPLSSAAAFLGICAHAQCCSVWALRLDTLEVCALIIHSALELGTLK